jgi:broad specificity phosphatase PhoE
MQRIFLLRHAMPVQEPAADPADWVLAPEGVEAARRLAPLLPADAVLVSSDEPKALATLATAAPGRVVAAEPGLREVRRPREPFDDTFRGPRLAYVAGRPPVGWEPPAEVAARVQAAVERHGDGSRPLVLAGHGMAFTTWLAGRGLLDDPAAFWSALRLPDLLEVADGRVRRAGPP